MSIIGEGFLNCTSSRHRTHIVTHISAPLESRLARGAGHRNYGDTLSFTRVLYRVTHQFSLDGLSLRQAATRSVSVRWQLQQFRETFDAFQQRGEQPVRVR